MIDSMDPILTWIQYTIENCHAITLAKLKSLFQKIYWKLEVLVPNFLVILVDFLVIKALINMWSQQISTLEDISQWDQEAIIQTHSSDNLVRKMTTNISQTTWKQVQTGSETAIILINSESQTQRIMQRNTRLLKRRKITQITVINMVMFILIIETTYGKSFLGDQGAVCPAKVAL